MTSFGYYMQRVRELGFRESVRQATTIVADRAAARVNGLYGRYFNSSVEEQAEQTIDRLLRRPQSVADFKTRSAPRFFLDKSPEFYCKAIENHFPEEKQRIITAANLIKDRTFDLLGSGPRHLPDLPWHVDFKSGYAWDPNTFCREIRYGNVAGVDVKVPWELSRFQHAMLLGQAYWLTGNEEYPAEFRSQVVDWIEKNPTGYGVNWACAMDVGIRAVNWIWGFYFFRRSSLIDGEFMKLFLHSLYRHAKFIRSNLEYRTATVRGQDRRLNSNHYLSNIIGLLYIGLMFPELDTAGDVEFAKSELCTEIFEQTYPDGADYEHSTFYHRLVTEIFLSGFLLLKRNGHQLPPEVEDRLIAMGRYVADYLRPDGTAPQIGDADNGRLHPLAIREMGDHRYVPNVIGETYGLDDLRVAEGDIEALWWIGATPSAKARPARGSVSYVNHNFAILRCERAHVFVSAAPICMHGLGSHSHNDILSFEYWSQGRSWIVDPGTYIYTPDPASRNYFRSTEAHNTVRIDRTEINPFFPERLFQLPDHARVTCHDWKDADAFTEFDAEHNGYEIVHRRRFRLDKATGNLEIDDLLTGSGVHEFEWFFHFSPGTLVDLMSDGAVLRHGENTLTLRFDSDSGQYEKVDGWYSPSYGVREPAPVLVRRLTAPAPVQLKTWIINKAWGEPDARKNDAPDFRN